MWSCPTRQKSSDPQHRVSYCQNHISSLFTLDSFRFFLESKQKWFEKLFWRDGEQWEKPERRTHPWISGEKLVWKNSGLNIARGSTYIQKTGIACWKIPQKIQIFRRKILSERENYQFCKRPTGIFKDQSELTSLAEQVLGFRSYMPLENTQ